MDSALSANAAPSTRSGPERRIPTLGWWLIIAAFVAYGILLARNVGAYAGGSDSSGYMNHARLLGEGHVHIAPRSIAGLPPADTPNWLYSPLGFKVANDGKTLVPTYPSGVPLWIAAAAKLVGWNEAGNVVIWLHGMAGVLITFLAGRAFGLSPRGSILAAVIIGSSPVYFFITLQALSDVPALVWTTAAIVAAWRSRSYIGWAFAAGAAFAMAVLIRPTDTLAILPIAIALGFSWRRWLAFGVSGIPGAIFFCLHSHAAYGKMLTTGYGDDAGLKTEWVKITLQHYAKWLPILFTPIAAVFLALPFLLRRIPLLVVLLVSWVGIFAAFYSAYEPTHETWWYLRFLLPAAPALVIGALLVIQLTVTPRLKPRSGTVMVCLALAATVAWNARWTKTFFALDAGRGERVYPETAAWLNQHLPPNAVVAAMQGSGALFYYTEFTFVRWDALEPRSFSRLTDALNTAHRPLYAVLWPFEINEQGVIPKHMPTGTWTKIGMVRDVSIWQWSATSKPSP